MALSMAEQGRRGLVRGERREEEVMERAKLPEVKPKQASCPAQKKRGYGCVPRAACDMCRGVQSNGG